MELLLNAHLNRPSNQNFINSLLAQPTLSIPTGVISTERIKQFIESNQNCQESIQLLSPKNRKFSSTIFRLYFEHFMAKNWSAFHQGSFESNCLEINQQLVRNFDSMPYNAKRVAKKVVKKNLLVQLGTLKGLNDYILQMRRYNSYNTLIIESIGDLVNHYQKFNDLFILFMHDVTMEIVQDSKKMQTAIAS